MHERFRLIYLDCQLLYYVLVNQFDQPYADFQHVCEANGFNIKLNLGEQPGATDAHMTVKGYPNCPSVKSVTNKILSMKVKYTDLALCGISRVVCY